VSDEVLAGAAALVGVALAGERECAGDQVAVGPGGGIAGVLLEDGEEVAEEAPVVGAERRCGSRHGSGRRIGDGVDRPSSDRGCPGRRTGVPVSRGGSPGRDLAVAGLGHESESNFGASGTSPGLADGGARPAVVVPWESQWRSR